MNFDEADFRRESLIGQQSRLSSIDNRTGPRLFCGGATHRQHIEFIVCVDLIGGPHRIQTGGQSDVSWRVRKETKAFLLLWKGRKTKFRHAGWNDDQVLTDTGERVRQGLQRRGTKVIARQVIDLGSLPRQARLHGVCLRDIDTSLYPKPRGIWETTPAKY